MTRQIAIIGSGILGAALAFRLQQPGVCVTVIDAGAPGATDASFGWINASYYLDEDHFHLRHAGLEAYARLADELALPLRQTGCLCWEQEGAQLAEQADQLCALGYPVRHLDQSAFAALEPHVANPPRESLLFNTEAVAEPALLRRALLDAAQSNGARLLSGVRITRLATDLQMDVGSLACDDVVVAAGIGTPALLATLDVPLPMVSRPAYIVETRPMAPLANHVLVSPQGEVRQMPDGRLIAPASLAHQGDTQDRLTQSADNAAAQTTDRLRTLFGDLSIEWAKVSRAERPVPQDGRPVIGHIKEGVYVATMHSGMTLAAVTADLAANEILNGPSNATSAQLASFRPQRYWAK